MTRFIKYVSVVIFALAALTSCHKDSVTFPHGWRLPTSTEIDDDWRKKDIDRYMIVKGDFNGDGVIDEARVLVRENGSGLGLFSFVSQKDHTVKAYLLDELKGVNSIHTMGIMKVSPGLYKTACGKGYWECNKGEVPEISLQHDAIDYFKTESANSYFYWDIQAKIFKRIWISD